MCPTARESTFSAIQSNNAREDQRGRKHMKAVRGMRMAKAPETRRMLSNTTDMSEVVSWTKPLQTLYLWSFYEIILYVIRLYIVVLYI